MNIVPPLRVDDDFEESSSTLFKVSEINMPSRVNQKIRGVLAIFRLAAKKFFLIDGTQWAGAFAFNAFFSLFPLMILLVTIASTFTDRGSAATGVIAYIEGYVPISGEMQGHVFDTIADVMKTREQVGIGAFFILVWVTIQCFTTLIYATNHAWRTEAKNWWRLSLKSLLLLGITAGAVLLGMVLPILAKMAEDSLFQVNSFSSWIHALWGILIPFLIVFFSLSLFYKLAPHRLTRFFEVWVAALCATVLLQMAGSLFVIYLEYFSTLNAVYGAFGGIMALLLWIYLSGCIFIFGACLCSAQAEVRSSSTETIIAS